MEQNYIFNMFSFFNYLEALKISSHKELKLNIKKRMHKESLWLAWWSHPLLGDLLEGLSWLKRKSDSWLQFIQKSIKGENNSGGARKAT